MKNFTAEQKLLILVCLITLGFLSYQVVSINYSLDVKNVNTNNSEIKNIEKLEHSLAEFSDFTYQPKADLFFFPEKKKIVEKKEPVKIIPKGKISFKFNGKVNIFDDIRILIISKSKAKIKIKGKTKDYQINDKMIIAQKILDKEINGKATDETKQGDNYISKILHISSREIYISLPNKKALLISLRGNPKIVDVNKVPSSSGSLRNETNNGGHNDRRRRR